MNEKVEKETNNNRQTQGLNRVNELPTRNCPSCGSDNIGCFANGLCFCRNCGRVWESERWKSTSKI